MPRPLKSSSKTSLSILPLTPVEAHLQYEGRSIAGYTAGYTEELCIMGLYRRPARQADAR
jgi:hypothetical protein